MAMPAVNFVGHHVWTAIEMAAMRLQDQLIFDVMRRNDSHWARRSLRRSCHRGNAHSTGKADHCDAHHPTSIFVWW
jgi:hypothetical protein